MNLHYSYTLPEVTILLISAEADEVQYGLEQCKELYELMIADEVQARGDPVVDATLRSWSWPENQWCKEALVTLREFDFKIVPPEVVDACKGKWYGFNQTVVVEVGNQKLQDGVRETCNGAMARKTRWRKLQLSNVPYLLSRTVLIGIAKGLT